MRLDKYLKVSRIIKRRTVAKEACDKGIVTINGKVAGIGRVVGDYSIVCCLSDICVKPEYQGRGIGLKIVTKLKEMIEERKGL